MNTPEGPRDNEQATASVEQAVELTVEGKYSEALPIFEQHLMTLSEGTINDKRVAASAFSYYGLCVAAVKRRYSEGVKYCEISLRSNPMSPEHRAKSTATKQRGGLGGLPHQRGRAIYPITPSSPWASSRTSGRPRAARTSGARSPMSARCSPRAAPPGAVHGSLQAGALTTTFTASQGLLLMIPNMYKIAGELTRRCSTSRRARWPPTRCRSSATTRRHGLPPDRLRACCAAASVQEAHDFALIAQAPR
jgi:hypothetical protein